MNEMSQYCIACEAAARGNATDVRHNCTMDGKPRRDATVSNYEARQVPALKPLTAIQRAALASCDVPPCADGTSTPVSCAAWGSTTVHVLRERGFVIVGEYKAAITDAGRLELSGGAK